MFKEQMPFIFPVYIRRLFGFKRVSIGSWIAAAILVCLTLAAVTTAAEMREIELSDGSVITGEVVSLSGGIYTVRSSTLGTLRIEASKVRVIRLPGSAAPRDAGSQAKSLEDKMLGDSDIMETIRVLQNDPDFQQILQDPEIMKAVQTGDFDALMNNPKFMKLLNKQAVQDINKKLAR
jgi:hypothetical protein